MKPPIKDPLFSIIMDIGKVQKKLPFPIVLHENLREYDDLPIKDKTAEFALSPKCPCLKVPL